jgi:hypothetical protein
LAQHNLERQLTPEIQLFVIPDPSIVIPDSSIVIPDSDPGSMSAGEMDPASRCGVTVRGNGPPHQVRGEKVNTDLPCRYNRVRQSIFARKKAGKTGRYLKAKFCDFNKPIKNGKVLQILGISRE